MRAEDSHPPIWLEAAAALLVPAAAVGFSRVFADTDTVMPIIGAGLVSSAISVMCRRLRMPLLATAAISFGLLFLLLMNRYAPGTAQLGIIPTGETIDGFRALADELVVSFREQQSPVPALPAFVASAMAGAWIMAFLTDWGGDAAPAGLRAGVSQRVAVCLYLDSTGISGPEPNPLNLCLRLRNRRLGGGPAGLQTH